MSIAKLKERLERHGLRPHRDLGQNFLVDASRADDLARRAGVGAEDTVIEVGVGLGVLSLALARRAKRVVGIEIDSGLVRALREDAVLPDSVELLHADVLDLDLAALIAAETPPVRLVANLPYSAASPLLRRLLDLRDVLVDWSVMVQTEVAERLVASVGAKAYGSFAVLHQLTVDVWRELELGPRSFYPAPKVDSTFVRIAPFGPEQRPHVSHEELLRLEVVVRGAFGQRRKTVANALRGSGVADDRDALEAVLREVGIDPRARAETIEPERFLALSRALVVTRPRPR